MKREDIENRMAVDSQRPESENYEKLPVCECYGEEIEQFMALHILSGNKKIWICNKCIESMKEETGY